MKNQDVFRWNGQPGGRKFLAECAAACGVLALMTWGGFTLHANLATVSYLYFLLVIAMAMYCGFWQASLTSVLAVLCLDYFFTVPVLHFYMSDPREWVALGAFQITALLISRLAAKELRSAREARIHRKGMEQLYELSRSLLLLDLRQAPGAQLVLLIQRVFELHAVALFDANLDRQDRAGEWDESEENLARDCYFERASYNGRTDTEAQVLLAGGSPVGALGVRGKLRPLVFNALSALAAVSIERFQSFEKEERAEIASREEQLRGAVLDALAHELKTPLTAVQTASTGLLELGGLTDSQHDLVSLIDDEAIRLNSLCTRLLQTAELEAGQVGLQIDEVNVRLVMTEFLEGQSAELGKDKLRLVMENPNLTLRLDRGLLLMILAQYIDNARKYSTPNTEIEIAVRESRAEVLFSVHNFGSTIQIEDRERVFDRFYRASELKESVPGTGIGLSVVRKAAEAHHGHVWVISDEKEGTTFFLSLPTGARRKH